MVSDNVRDAWAPVLSVTRTFTEDVPAEVGVPLIWPELEILNPDGSPVAVDTVPVWWGGAGTDVQHSFFQALHQGSAIVPADFIGTVRNDDPHAANHEALLSNLLAQAEALANGQSSDDPHKVYPGGRPSTTILLDALTPQSLGALLAMYEHSVYVQSVLWGINAFDQFGVELGKQVASSLLPALRGESKASDPVTVALVEHLRIRWAAVR